MRIKQRQKKHSHQKFFNEKQENENHHMKSKQQCKNRLQFIKLCLDLLKIGYEVREEANIPRQIYYGCSTNT